MEKLKRSQIIIGIHESGEKCNRRIKKRDSGQHSNCTKPCVCELGETKLHSCHFSLRGAESIKTVGHNWITFACIHFVQSVTLKESHIELTSVHHICSKSPKTHKQNIKHFYTNSHTEVDNVNKSVRRFDKQLPTSQIFQKRLPSEADGLHEQAVLIKGWANSGLGRSEQLKIDNFLIVLSNKDASGSLNQLVQPSEV